jgi:biopolymer transport protein ExbD
MKNSGKKLNIVINVDPDVPYIFAVEAMNACVTAGLEDIKFSAQKRRLFKVDDGRISKVKRE